MPTTETRGDAADARDDDARDIAIFAPALLLNVEIHHSVDEQPEVHLHAGGQGYWVARMVRALGCRPHPCVCVGGESGVALRSLIEADGFDAWFTTTARANAVHVDDRRGDEIVRLVETEIPLLDRHEIDELYSSIIGASMRAGVCVVAGTQLAPILSDDVFGRLVRDLRANDVTVVVDVCGTPLEVALEAGVDVVKLSLDELLADGWAHTDSVADVEAGITRIQEAGARAVVVSRADQPTIAAEQGRIIEVRTPSLEVLDGRGGGDSMTAALAVGAATGLDFDGSLRLAAGAAVLNISRHGLGTGRLDAIAEIAPRVELIER
ncbi:MAG: PfkB family carbohydrate kinase [Ilumatobacteraceae bacterium]